MTGRCYYTISSLLCARTRAITAARTARTKKQQQHSLLQSLSALLLSSQQPLVPRQRRLKPLALLSHRCYRATPFVSRKRQQQQQEKSGAADNKKRNKRRVKKKKRNRKQLFDSSSSSKRDGGGGRRRPLPIPSSNQLRHLKPDSIYNESSSATNDTTKALPCLFSPTASPYVFVAKAALDLQQSSSDDDQDEYDEDKDDTDASSSTRIDPSVLFSDVVSGKEKHNKSIIPRSLFPPPGNFVHEGCLNSVKETETTSSSNPSLMHRDCIPQVAFLGRSNVGKSSLINALIQERDLARTSKTPGRTQQVHYFGWHRDNKNNDSGSSGSKKKYWLVDLPGYGHAAGPDAAVEGWQALTQEYLWQAAVQHKTLCRLYLLQDGRHGGQTLDYTVQGWMDEAGIPYTVVLTKADATNQVSLLKWVNQIAMRYHHHHEDMSWQHDGDDDDDDDEEQFDSSSCSAMSPIVHVVSAKTGTGLQELWSSIETDFISFEEEDDDEDDE